EVSCFQQSTQVAGYLSFFHLSKYLFSNISHTFLAYLEVHFLLVGILSTWTHSCNRHLICGNWEINFSPPSVLPSPILLYCSKLIMQLNISETQSLPAYLLTKQVSNNMSQTH
ncbi:LOW QUALITY PROTEIN: hypothetical protein TorRG33x02_065830, partial [Trema orientale]